MSACTRPVRCWTCAKVLPWEKYFALKSEKPDTTVSNLADELKLRRFCCRRFFYAHPEEFERINNLYITTHGNTEEVYNESIEEVFKE
jgi:DNA-directed RNA polymerase subunit N (RpoN/RPB10)